MESNKNLRLDKIKSLLWLFSYRLPERNQVHLNVLHCHPHQFADKYTCNIEEQDNGRHGRKGPKPRGRSHQLDQVQPWGHFFWVPAIEKFTASSE